MERVTLRMPEPLLKRIDRQVDNGVYPSRSEAIRDYSRDGVESDEDAEDGRSYPLTAMKRGD